MSNSIILTNTMNNIIKNIRADLQSSVDPSSKDVHKRFFKEEVKFYGLKSTPLHAISKKYWQEVKAWDKKDFFALCEELLKSGWGEEAILVGTWMPKIYKKFEWKDIYTFREWIDKYIDNWAECDTFCNHTLEKFLLMFPEAVGEIKSWTASQNRWMKRASAVSLIIPARKGEYLEEVFEIATRLLESKDDMVQKGYGWMLKEASKQHRLEVFDFVVKHKDIMPRTALRYAIEKMPEDMRLQAMAK